MKIILKAASFHICFALGLLFGNDVLAQGNIKVDFTSNCSSSNACNVFQSATACSLNGTAFKLKTSHGSPHYIVFNSDKFVRLDADITGEEGFFLEYAFVEGNDYKIDVKVIGPSETDRTSTVLKVGLANGVSVQDDGCNVGSAPSVTDFINIIDKGPSDYSYQAPKTFTITKKPLKDYKQLWIRSTSNGTAKLGVDLIWIMITETVNIPAVRGNSICCDQTICSGSLPTSLEQASGITLTTTTTPTFQWQASTVLT